jgi:NAD(P)-dependent dehydrogenase (short-subunit alcohol dehydrogenase family)
MSTDRTNKVVIITGGSRGIGRATALMAGEQGYKVVVNYTSRADAAEAVKAEIIAKGGQAIIAKADIANEAEVIAMFEAAAKFGQVWGLVNNAGIVEADQRLDQMSVERLNRVFTINITGAFICAREAVKRMSTKFGGKGGSIVNISSMNSILGGAGRAIDYAATKGAIDSFTIGLAREVAREGIRVNAVRPGPFETDILRLDENPQRLVTINDTVPMGRIGQPHEAAFAILSLMDERMGYTTAAILNVSGGR